jgi:hypothetical protein
MQLAHAAQVGRLRAESDELHTELHPGRHSWIPVLAVPYLTAARQGAH